MRPIVVRRNPRPDLVRLVRFLSGVNMPIPRKRPRPLYVEQLEPRIALNSYFVSPTGNDNNAGTSAAPWLTLQQAADQVVAGDVVTVEAGTYAGFVLGWNFPQNGTAT